MAKIKLNENEMRGVIKEAISNVKAKESNMISINESDIKRLVESVIDEYYQHPSFQEYKVSAEFMTDNEVPFNIIGKMSYGPGDDGANASTLEDYELEDAESYSKEELDDINNYVMQNAQAIIDELLSKSEGQDPYEEGERDYEPGEY